MGSNISDARVNAQNISEHLKSIILETVVDMGLDGAPSGAIYAAMTTIGMSLDTYQALVNQLVNEGLIRISHNVLHATAAGILTKPTNR